MGLIECPVEGVTLFVIDKHPEVKVMGRGPVVCVGVGGGGGAAVKSSIIVP